MSHFFCPFLTPPVTNCHTFSDPPLKYVTLWGKKISPIFLMVGFTLQNSISSKIRQVLSSKIADDLFFFFFFFFFSFYFFFFFFSFSLPSPFIFFSPK